MIKHSPQWYIIYKKTILCKEIVHEQEDIANNRGIVFEATKYLIICDLWCKNLPYGICAFTLNTKLKSETGQAMLTDTVNNYSKYTHIVCYSYFVRFLHIIFWVDHWNKTIQINGNKPCLAGLVKTMTVSASGDGFGVSSFSSSSSLDSASVFYNKTTNFF